MGTLITPQDLLIRLMMRTMDYMLLLSLVHTGDHLFRHLLVQVSRQFHSTVTQTPEAMRNGSRNSRDQKRVQKPRLCRMSWPTLSLVHLDHQKSKNQIQAWWK